MQHEPYRKIPESLQGLQLSEAAHRQMARARWVVTEKVHGANFCVLTNGKAVAFAKRKALLSPEEDFFGYHLLRPTLEVAARTALAALPGAKHLRIYGELFGGAYPHPEVHADARVQAVQTGVWYHPSVQFICFDMVVTDAAGTRYLDFAELEAVCAGAGLRMVPALLQGSWQEALAFPVEFPSGIPGLYGLPALAGNLAEGVVLKPAHHLEVDGGKGPFRPVVKRKLPRFAEDARFHGAEKWAVGAAGGGPGSGPVVAGPGSGPVVAGPGSGPVVADAAFLEAEVRPLLTRQRLQSAVSKVGRLTARTRGRILKELVADVLRTLEERFPQLEEEDGPVGAWVAREARKLMK